MQALRLDARKAILCSALAIAASALAWKYLRQRNYPVKVPMWMFKKHFTTRKDRHSIYGLMEIYDELGGPPVITADPLFGLVRVVWLTNLETMKEFMVENQKISSGRRVNTIVKETEGHLGIIDAQADAVSARRKLVLQAMRNLGLGRSQLQNQVSQEAERLVNFIAKEKNLECTEFSREFMRATANVICSLVLGKRFEYDDDRMTDLFKRLKAIFDKPTGTTLGANLPRSLWWLARHIDASVPDRIDSYNQIKTFGDSEIREHRQHPEIQGTIIRACLDMQEKQPDVFTDGVIRGMLADLLIAGTDTSSNTLEFCVLHLACEQQLQEQIYQELSTKLQPDLSDLSMENTDQIPLTMAFIHETMRFNPVAPGTLPHTSKTDVKLRSGVVIPAGSFVIGSTVLILRKDSRWKNPSSFDINNFLTEDGKFSKPEMFVPFGLGPRSCVGEKLARVEIVMFLAHMINKFRFVPIDGHVYERDSGAYSGVMRPKPYKVKAIIRN